MNPSYTAEQFIEVARVCESRCPSAAEALRYAATLQAEIVRLQAEKTWQPIETHDGTYSQVLVCANDRFVQVGEAEWRGDGDGDLDGWAWEGYGYRIYPTHWMPLPAAPVPEDPPDAR